jgi:hypothetical protein
VPRSRRAPPCACAGACPARTPRRMISKKRLCKPPTQRTRPMHPPNAPNAHTPRRAPACASLEPLTGWPCPAGHVRVSGSPLPEVEQLLDSLPLRDGHYSNGRLVKSELRTSFSSHIFGSKKKLYKPPDGARCTRCTNPMHQPNAPTQCLLLAAR